MYRTADGEEIFIIDGHTHLWDGSKENLKNIHGQQFIDCFYGYHSALSPKEYVWPKEKFDKYGAETMYNDLFVEGYDDMAIFQPTYLKAQASPHFPASHSPRWCRSLAQQRQSCRAR
jgi:hypothetical protein